MKLGQEINGLILQCSRAHTWPEVQPTEYTLTAAYSVQLLA